MKNLLPGAFAILVTILISACSKDNDTPADTANIYIINAAIDAGQIKVNAGAGSGFAYSRATAINYGAIAMTGSYPGSNRITAVSSADTTKTYFTGTVDFKKINTFYLAGRATAIDTIFRAENNVPYIQSAVLKPDSSVYIRFVNLSPNSTPLNITIKSATSNEVTGLSYKGITEFKKYAAKASNATYIFEVRDVATNTLQTTFTFNSAGNRFRTVALLVRGLMGTTSGTNAFGIVQANYY